ncbi:MAG: 4-hydroxy-tetrahydrodipicolinate synthase [Candidatus Helarchaeota archaeon]
MPQVFTAITTPFQKDGEINYGELENLVGWQIQTGIDGVVICGTNGEFASLSFEEVKLILKRTLDMNQEEVTMIAGTGRASLKETIELCKFVEESADMALIVPPFYFKNPDIRGLYNYFKRLLEKTQVPLLLYNIPKYTGIPISPELLSKLQKYENLVGVKDSSGNIATIENFIHQFPKLSIYAGSDALIFSSFEKGAKGCISAIATCFPEEVLDIKISHLAGQKQKARTAQEKVSEIRSIIKQFPNRGAIKTVLSFRGFPLSYVRPPLLDLTEDQSKNLRKMLATFL